jgi:hypothetical protein
MQKGFAPFFAEADLAHQWLGHAPVYVVRSATAAPRADKDWDGVALASLAQGNYGGKPDFATHIALVCHGDDLWVRFAAEEPTPLDDKDTLRLTIKNRDRSLTINVGPQGAWGSAGEQQLPPSILVSSRHQDGWWRAQVKLPTSGLGLEPGRTEALQAQVERHRAPRGQGKSPAADYYWMPPMKVPWGEQFRFGQIRIGG